MAVARARHIAGLLEVHFEDLAFLWGQRRGALGSRKHTLREFGELNERIEAHIQGLLVAGADALTSMLQPRLATPERDEAFAAACAMLRRAEPASTHSVIVEFSRAAGTTLAGLRDALGFAPHALFAAELQSALDQAKPATAVAAAAVLANHRLLDAHSPRLAALLEDPDPLVCELAWRCAAVADAQSRQQAPRRNFKAALGHVDASVRHAGWTSVAWSGQARALPLLRHLANGGDAVAVHWLAVLGSDEDAPLLHKAALAVDDPALRCALLARFGHPTSIHALLRWMDADDVVLVVAAGEAFTRITGMDIRGQRTTIPVPEGADEFAIEMAPIVWLPDAAKAKALIERHDSAWAARHRWCAGVPIDGELDRGALATMDFEARWDTAARVALHGRRLSSPAPIH